MEQASNELRVKSSRTRFTVENKECKKEWMHNNALIHGCTTRTDPDGMQEKEWCRTVNQDEKDWGYCDDQLDMDSVRQAVNDFYEADIKIIKLFF